MFSTFKTLFALAALVRKIGGVFEISGKARNLKHIPPFFASEASKKHIIKTTFRSPCFNIFNNLIINYL
jgi:hypothetical protein